LDKHGKRNKNYCNSCASCQKYNYACLHNRAPLKPLEVTRPWQLVGCDFMGPFKTSRHGNKYIIFGIDHLTKFAEGAATPSFDAVTTALFLVDNIVCRYGMIEKLLTDQGVKFESKLVSHLCTLLGTEKLHTSTYHPVGNGITERLNKTVKPNLAMFVNDEHDDWDLFLQMAISAYNNSCHTAIKMSPYEAQFGRPPVLVADVIMNNQLPSNTRVQDVADFTIALRKSAEYINDMIQENTEAARKRMKANYDRFVQQKIIFHVGDYVKISNCRTRVNKSKSFESKFLGPYRITKRVTELDYRLEAPNLATEIVHYNRMYKYTVRDQYLEPQKVIVDTPAQKQVIPSITDREILTNIIHSPSLRVLKARATKRSIVAELIRSADIINTCRSVVPFTSRVNCMGLIEEVMVGRAELCFSLPMPQVVEHVALVNMFIIIFLVK
jgi:hypothetical protein